MGFGPICDFHGAIATCVQELVHIHTTMTDLFHKLLSQVGFRGRFPHPSAIQITTYCIFEAWLLFVQLFVHCGCDSPPWSMFLWQKVLFGSAAEICFHNRNGCCTSDGKDEDPSQTNKAIIYNAQKDNTETLHSLSLTPIFADHRLYIQSLYRPLCMLSEQRRKVGARPNMHNPISPLCTH